MLAFKVVFEANRHRDARVCESETVIVADTISDVEQLMWCKFGEPSPQITQGHIKSIDLIADVGNVVAGVDVAKRVGLVALEY